jgi:hypothetical protein
LRRAPENIEGVTLHFSHVRNHRGSVFAQRQSTLIAQKQFAADPLLEPIDPSHQGRARQAKHFTGVPETLVSRANEKRFQIVPGRIRSFLSPVLHHRSTPMQ